VLWPYNPWDQGTRGGFPINKTAASAADSTSLASLLSATDSDGFFGDTISSAGMSEFYAKVSAILALAAACLLARLLACS